MNNYKIIIAAILLSVLCSQLAAHAADPAPGQTAWLREHSIPIATVEAEHGFADLAPWRALTP